MGQKRGKGHSTRVQEKVGSTPNHMRVGSATKPHTARNQRGRGVAWDKKAGREGGKNRLFRKIKRAKGGAAGGGAILRRGKTAKVL